MAFNTPQADDVNELDPLTHGIKNRLVERFFRPPTLLWTKNQRAAALHQDHASAAGGSNTLSPKIGIIASIGGLNDNRLSRQADDVLRGQRKFWGRPMLL